MPPPADDPGRFQRQKQIFDLVVDLPQEQWLAAVEAESAGDDALVAEVMALLEQAGQPSEALGDAVQTQVTRVSPQSPAAALGDDERLRDVPTVNGYPVLDRYVIYRFIGAGGFGRVYRGSHLMLGTDVAIKCLGPEVQKHAEADTRFEREARLGANLKSQHLVQVQDLNRRHGLLYLVMEWVEGEDLAQRIERLGQRPWQEVIVLLSGLAKGLAEVHEHAIVHRDIKPANAMLAKDGIVKLADLGLARHTLDTQMQMSMQGVGTPAYMAPEQWDSLHEAGAPADVFSFGATAWHLLTGHPPPRKRDVEMRERLLRGKQMPEDLANLVMQCLAEDPEQRPPDGTALVARLEQLRQQHSLPEQLAADQLQLPTDAPSAGLAESTRTEIRKQWETSGQRGATTPITTPSLPGSRRSLLLLALAAAATATLGVWIGTGGLDDNRRPPNPGQNPDRRKAQPGANANVDGKPKPDDAQTQPAPDAPKLALAMTEITLDQQSQRVDDAAVVFEQPELDFGTTRTAQLTIRFNRAPDGNERPRFTSDISGEADWQLSSCSLPLILPPGEHAITFPLDGQQRVITIRVPRNPPFINGLELLPEDQRTSTYYLIPGMSDPIRFLHLGGDLLVGATEVTLGQFLAFAATEEYVRRLQEDAPFVAWLRSISSDATVARRAEQWRKKSDEASAKLPMTRMHPSEAVAYADWLGSKLDGIEIQLPTTEQWCSLANRNAQRPIESRGVLPFASDGSDVSRLANCATTVTIDQNTANTEIGDVEPVWTRSRRQGQLYHIGGNVAELCVDGRNGRTPTGGTVRGGSYAEPASAMRLPAAAAARAWQLADYPKLPAADIGFRLVLKFR